MAPSPSCSLQALMSVLLLAAGVDRVALAQRAGNDDGGETALRMREDVSRSLGEAQACVEMEDYECAHRVLGRLRGRTLHSYEEALMWRFYAFVHFEQDDTAGAIAAYESLLAVPDLPGGLEQESALTLAQLYAQQERFADALRLLDRWFSLVDDPGPDQHYLKALLYYQMQRYEEGIEPLERAIALAESRGREPEQNWYNLLRVLYFETGGEQRLLALLRTMVELWPKKEYVVHLAGMYGERGEEERQLALVEVAYEAGWLTTGSELASYASMLLGAQIPYAAAVVIEQGLGDGTIEPTEQNWRLLGQSWRLAQEDERALPALERAAELADDGRVYYQLASSFANLHRAEECVDAARKAIERGLERADEARIVLGVCLTDAGRHAEALAAFEQAARDERSRDAARDHIRYVESEIDLARRLEEAIAASP